MSEPQTCVKCGHTDGVDRGGQCVRRLSVPSDSVAVWDDNHCGCHCVFPAQREHVSVAETDKDSK